MSLSACRACHNTDLKLHSSLGSFPIHLWPLSQPDATLNGHHKEPLELFACSHCGHLQLQEMTELLVNQIYAGGFYYVDDIGLKKARLKNIKDYLGNDFFQKRRVLDVGGGNNPFTGFIPEAERWVSDIDNDARKLIGKTADHVVIGDFAKSDLPKNHFDVITGFHVMEHFRWPVESVMKMSEIITDEGKVIIEVPNFSNISVTKPYYAVFHQHQSMFTEQSLNTLFAQGGFLREALIRADDVLLAVYTKSKSITNKIFSFNGLNALGHYRSQLDYVANKIKQSDFYTKEMRLGIYGGGGSSMLMLSHFPFLKERVHMAFDRDTEKTDKYIPGTKIAVSLPEDLHTTKNINGLLFLSDSLYKLVAPQFSGESFDLTQIMPKL